MMEKSMKAALDAAMKDLFKDWKQREAAAALRSNNPREGDRGASCRFLFSLGKVMKKLEKSAFLILYKKFGIIYM